MKKVLYIFLVGILIFSVACSSSSNKPTNRASTSSSNSALVSEIKVEYNFDVFDWTVDKDGRIFIADKDYIIMYDNSGKKTDFIKEGLEFCTCIAFDNKTIYVWDDKSASLKLFSLDGKCTGEYPIKLQSGKIRKIFASGKNVFLLQQRQASVQGNQILVFDITTKGLRELNFKNVIGFCRYKEGQLLLSVQDEPYTRFIIYDFIKNKNLKEFNEITIFYNDFYYNENDNMVYYLSSNSINTLDLDSGISKSLYNSSYEILAKLCIQHPYCYAFGPVEDRICKVDLSENLKTNSRIVIYSPLAIDNNPHINKWEEIIEDKYPEVKIEFQTVGISEYIDRLKLKLLASESEPDIFYLSRFEADDFAKNSAVLDLGKYDSIVKRFNKLLNGIKRNCTIGEILVGIPFIMSMEAWGVNTELAEKLKLQIPRDIWSLDEFYMLARKARADLNGDGTKDSYIAMVETDYPFFLRPYLSAHINIVKSEVDIDTNQLSKSLSLLKKMLDDKLLLQVRTEERNKINNILFYYDSFGLVEGDECRIPPPVIDKDNPIYVNNLEMLCINKYSKKVDLATELMALYLSNDVQLSLPFNAVLEDLDIFEQPDGPGPGLDLGVLSNETNKTLYKHMVEYSYHRFWRRGFFEGFTDIINECLSGRITPDAAAKAIIDKAKMIVGE